MLMDVRIGVFSPVMRPFSAGKRVSKSGRMAGERTDQWTCGGDISAILSPGQRGWFSVDLLKELKYTRGHRSPRWPV